MSLSAVDADGDVSRGRTKLLVESPVGADPQVLLCDFHLTQGQSDTAELHLPAIGFLTNSSSIIKAGLE